MILTDCLHEITGALLGVRCHLCGHPVTGRYSYVCNQCMSRLPQTGFFAPGNNIMSDKFLRITGFERAGALFFYTPDSDLSVIVHHMKYHGGERMCRQMGRNLAAEILSRRFAWDADVIVPVPIHWTRFVTRGYNQAGRMGEGMAEILGIPLKYEVEVVHRHRTQTHKTAAERATAVKGIFKLKSDYGLAGKHVLLIDDVCTTGATLHECARVLSAVPGIRISIATLGFASTL